MVKITAEQAVQMIQPGEEPHNAYARIYADQCKPCDFRRWYTMIRTTGECAEVSEDVQAEIQVLISEGVGDHEAFVEMFPDYVTHAAFDTAWFKQRRKKVPAVIPVEVEENAEEVPAEIDEPSV
jgi:hypothetical protein